jgi:hypothetical protein
LKGKKKMKNPPLLKTLAEACHYAQEHISCPDAWPQDAAFRENKLECVSYQIACFLAQNTHEGRAGVELDIILEDLISPMKTPGEWTIIISRLADFLGGWAWTNQKGKST